MKNRSINTIFITGFPRSGTTWFANLFNSHPDTIYRHEVIGRSYNIFSEQLFHALKHNHGLTDTEYEIAIDTILEAIPETDRPPFFKKNYHLISNKNIHQIVWLTCSNVPWLIRPYSMLYTPKATNATLVLKETRDSIDMDSMFRGLRANHIIFLFRSPYGAISSHLKGIESGKMRCSNQASRKLWFSEHKGDPYLLLTNVDEHRVLSMPEYEFLALRWRSHNEKYVNYMNEGIRGVFVNYENTLSNPAKQSEALFSIVGLKYDSPTADFIKKSSVSMGKKSVLMKDSKSSFYSVYREKNFSPDSWKDSLSDNQISIIRKHTKSTYEKLMLLVSSQ